MRVGSRRCAAIRTDQRQAQESYDETLIIYIIESRPIRGDFFDKKKFLGTMMMCYLYYSISMHKNHHETTTFIQRVKSEIFSMHSDIRTIGLSLFLFILGRGL